ncbi:MAG: hypothetical protein Q7K33_01735 [Candidatus Berkelbacteria bacterium]|nr:hypothetical protein [Candidatus Berkelbacteria bacterium]
MKLGMIDKDFIDVTVQALREVGLFGVITLMAALGSERIAEANAKRVADLGSGEVRWTDGRFAHVQANGSVVIDKDAPLSQWPHAVRLYKPDAGHLWVTIYRDPVVSKNPTIN